MALKFERLPALERRATFRCVRQKYGTFFQKILQAKGSLVKKFIFRSTIEAHLRQYFVCSKVKLDSSQLAAALSSGQFIVYPLVYLPIQRRFANRDHFVDQDLFGPLNI